MRENLKSATEGLITQDIDYVVFLKGNRFFLVEEKTHPKAKVSPPQAVIAQMLTEIFSRVSKDFLGYFLVYALEGEEPYVKLNGNNHVKFSKLIALLSGGGGVSYNNWFDRLIQENFDFLWDCNGQPRAVRTQSERTNIRPTNLVHFIRDLSLEYLTIDWIFVNYCKGYFVLIQESKINCTLRQIDRYLRYYNRLGNPVRNPKSGANYKYLGLYHINFNPFSGKHFLNGKFLNEEELIKVLNLDGSDIIRYLGEDNG